MTENLLIDNIIENYQIALNKKCFVEDRHHESITLYPDKENSIYLWNTHNCDITISNKCNHLLLYHCNNLNIYTKDLISGLTMIESHHCNLYLNKNSSYHMEISSSLNNTFCSNFFHDSLFYRNVDLKFKKKDRGKHISDHLFSNWNCARIDL